MFANALSGKQLPAPLLLDLRHFRGWTLGGLVRDLQFDVRHRRTFSRMSLAGGDGIGGYLCRCAAVHGQAEVFLVG
jgi:hypothetical protein